MGKKPLSLIRGFQMFLESSTMPWEKSVMESMNLTLGISKLISLEIPNVKFIDSMTLFSHGIVELSKNIWNPRIKERGFFPISLTLKKIRSM